MEEGEEYTTEEKRQRYFKAGKIAGEALSYGKQLVKPGARILDIAENIERKIRKLGGDPAFPVNISFDSTAAHDTPHPNDERVLSNEVVKLDVGVHVDGFVGGDTALTVDLSGNYGELVKASREALNAALKVAGPGVALSDIGKAIGETIESYGFHPVKNLSGHGLDEWSVHEPPTIPNFENGDMNVLQEGMFVAIEPFATDGDGFITEKGLPFIHSVTDDKPIRNRFAREVMEEVDEYVFLPFANRWLTKKFHPMKVNVALKEFKQLDILKSYPPLVEKTNGMVSQAEHSIYVGKDKITVMTKTDE
jgi:methionyl aminopeptidase